MYHSLNYRTFRRHRMRLCLSPCWMFHQYCWKNWFCPTNHLRNFRCFRCHCCYCCSQSDPHCFHRCCCCRCCSLRDYHHHHRDASLIPHHGSQGLQRSGGLFESLWVRRRPRWSTEETARLSKPTSYFVNTSRVCFDNGKGWITRNGVRRKAKSKKPRKEKQSKLSLKGKVLGGCFGSGDPDDREYELHRHWTVHHAITSLVHCPSKAQCDSSTM
jgi:hypothetical protein